MPGLRPNKFSSCTGKVGPLYVEDRGGGTDPNSEIIALYPLVMDLVVLLEYH